MKSYNHLRTKEKLGQSPYGNILARYGSGALNPNSVFMPNAGDSIAVGQGTNPRFNDMSQTDSFTGPAGPAGNGFGWNYVPTNWDDGMVQGVYKPATGTTTTSKTYTQAEMDAMVNARVEAALKQTAAQKQLGVSTFTRFEADDRLPGEVETVTAGIWSDNISSLTTYFTASAQTTTQRRYYVDVHHETPSAEGSAVQFSLAYGHALGSGSDSQGQLNDSPSRAVYAQYRRLLLAPGATRFITAGSGSTDHIYVINIKRNRLKERLDEGNFEIPLRKISTRAANATGSVAVTTGVYTLIDDSSINTAATKTDSGRVYNIVSGSISNGVYNSSSPVYYGLVYPDHGIMILDAKMLDQQLGFATNTTSSAEGNNHFVLFHSLSGSALVTGPSGDAYGFLARNSEKITSTHYFVRIKNGQYNFTNNPTFVTGSNGELSQPSFVNDPKTYITTVVYERIFNSC